MFHEKIRTKYAASIITTLAGIGLAVSLSAPAQASAQASTPRHLHHLHHLRVTHSTAQLVRAPMASAPMVSAGTFSSTAVENLWINAGGPAAAAPKAAQIAMCESGGQASAFNASGASGIFQILGQIVPGNIFDPQVNALNAVAKFKAAGNTFSPWVCQ